MSQLIRPVAITTGDAAISSASQLRIGPRGLRPSAVIRRCASTVTRKQMNSPTAVIWKKIWDAAICCG